LIVSPYFFLKNVMSFSYLSSPLPPLFAFQLIVSPVFFVISAAKNTLSLRCHPPWMLSPVAVASILVRPLASGQFCLMFFVTPDKESNSSHPCERMVITILRHVRGARTRSVRNFGRACKCSDMSGSCFYTLVTFHVSYFRCIQCFCFFSVFRLLFCSITLLSLLCSVHVDGAGMSAGGFNGSFSSFYVCTMSF